MRILTEYVIKEFFPSFLLGMGIFTFVLFTGKIFTLVTTVFMVSPPPEILFRLLGNILLINITFALPMGVLFGAVDSFTRLSADGEIVGINSSGLRISTFSRPLLITIFFLASFSLYLQSDVAPRANLALKEILEELKVGKITALMEERVHLDKFKNCIIYIDKIKGNKLRGITIYDLRKEDQNRTIIAQKGEISSSPDEKKVTLKLVNGTITEFDKDNLTQYTKTTFTTHFLEVETPQRTKKVEKKRWDMTIPELSRKIHYFREKNITPHSLLTELHKRISIAYSPIFFLLVGMLLGVKAKKKSKGLSFGLSLPVFVVYYIILCSTEIAGQRGLFSPLVLMWLPNLSLGAFAFLFKSGKRL